MRVDVLLFGPFAGMAGSDRVSVDLPGEQATAADVLGALACLPSLGSGVGACRLAVNHAFARSDAAIHETDEVALIGLVSGG